MTDDPLRELRRLEDRLSRYHEWLEDSLDRDRRFQLSATWGIVSGLISSFAFIAAIWIFDRWIGTEGLLLGVLAGGVAFIAWMAAFAWTSRGREDDEKKLSRLPKWEKMR